MSAPFNDDSADKISKKINEAIDAINADTPPNELGVQMAELIALFPPELREEALLTILNPMIKAMDVAGLRGLQAQIAEELPNDQDNPFVVAALNLIEGQLALRGMGDGTI